MAYRYCPECDKWYETAEYGVAKSGETVCKKEDHAAVTGYIEPDPINPAIELPYRDEMQARHAAERQNLI